LETNNIITYLDFVLSERVQVDLFPYGPPEDKYGATFGQLTLIPRREPPAGPSPLSPAAEKAVGEVQEHFKQRYGQEGLVFMAISGIDMTPDVWFSGPHVGSYYNCLFKRAILTADVPIVVFLDDTKIPSQFKVGKCFPVCSGAVVWPDLCRRTPLAMAVATSNQGSADELAKLFTMLGFPNLERGFDEGRSAYTVIGSNDQFRSLWGSETARSSGIATG
jgi:hypothetical protein